METATTIEKVCRVLNVFGGRPSPGLTEVAENTGLLKSDVHRILKSLEQFGFIEQDRESRREAAGSREVCVRRDDRLTANSGRAIRASRR